MIRCFLLNCDVPITGLENISIYVYQVMLCCVESSSKIKKKKRKRRDSTRKEYEDETEQICSVQMNTNA